MIISLNFQDKYMNLYLFNYEADFFFWMQNQLAFEALIPFRFSTH